MSKRPLLSMIAHSTDGSELECSSGDGSTQMLENGIHLRWFFNYKMGFPPTGFVLSRRKSNLQNKKCFAPDKIEKKIVPLPYNYIYTTPSGGYPRKNMPEISITSSDMSHLKIVDIASFPKRKVFEIKGNVNFHFSPRTSGIELAYYVTRGSHFDITALADKKVVWKRRIQGESNFISRNLNINVSGVDTLRFAGEKMFIQKVCYWICEDGEGWEIINKKCSYGLPYGQKGWPIASCRLGSERASSFKSNFDDLKVLLSEIEDEGLGVPIGWNLFSFGNETADPSEYDKPDLQISPYDILLMQSQNPDIARVLGLYWVDRNTAEGGYYDYKISANWPIKRRILWKLDNEVTFETLPEGYRYFYIFNEDKVVFLGSNPEIIDIDNLDYKFARVKRGLAFDYPEDTEIRIYFTEPVREVQFFISQLGKTEIFAYTEDDSVVDQNELNAKMGVLPVHSREPIRYIRLKGKGVVIQRICYDQEYLPYGEQKYIVCGIKKDKPVPLSVPSGLKARCLRRSTTTTKDNGEQEVYHYTAGLHWNIPESSAGLLSGVPTGYHIKRIPPDGESIVVTEGSPVHVVQSSFQIMAKRNRSEKKPGNNSGEGKINERQYYLDTVKERGRYSYRVSAVDLFGRQSSYSEAEEVLLTPALPPPPADVHAKFLDYNVYDQQKDSCCDQNLNQSEIAWLRTNQKSAIVVRWNWNDELQEQAPYSRGFHIYLKHGWLNSLQGTITNVIKGDKYFQVDAELKSDINILRQDIPENSLAGEWLRQGRMIFRINGNDASYSGTPILKLKIDIPPEYLDLPEAEIKPCTGMNFVLPVTKPVEQGGAALDYSDHKDWINLSCPNPVKTVPIIDPSQETYEVYIIDPKFPHPPFSINEPEKTRYAQIGVSTFFAESDEGEGSISPPSVILAVDRKKPITPAFPDPASLKATPADYHGKSIFTLPLPTSSDPEVKFYIYRAMDETLFMVDKIQRQNRSETDYQKFLNDNPEFKPGGINALDSGEVTALKAENPDYTVYQKSNNLLKALASLPGNERAFALLNDKPLQQHEYIDNTLDGRGDNKYFYRIRSINELGNLGPYSLATLPVEIPKVTPPPAPVITQISGGDRQITIRWISNQIYGPVEYRIYRTDSEIKTKDIRLMEQIGVLKVTSYLNSRSGQEEWIDKNVQGQRKEFWYCVMAMCRENVFSVSKVLKSKVAYITPPSPPVVLSGIWKTNQAGEKHVEISWICKEREVSFLVVRRRLGTTLWGTLAEQLRPIMVSNSYQYTDLKTVPEKGYEYKLFTKDLGHNLSIASNVLTVLPFQN